MSWKETPVEGMGAGRLWWNPVEAKGAGGYEKRRKGRTNSFRWNSDSVLPFLQGNLQPPKFPQDPAPIPSTGCAFKTGKSRRTRALRCAGG